MIRKTGIKILVRQSGIGYTAEPISKYWRAAFAKHMRKWKYSPRSVPFFYGTNTTDGDLCQAFFQGDYELPEEITQNRQYPELVKGWDITILVDPWVFGHWLGYNAHTVTYERS